MSLSTKIEAALARGGAFLVKAQSDEGAFRSDTYGALKDGYSLTPMALLALRFRKDKASARSYARGVGFLETLIDDKGALRVGLDGPSYPLYAASGALLIFSTPEHRDQKTLRRALVEAIWARQLSDKLGWRPTDGPFGGWGYHGGIPKAPPEGTRASRMLSSNLSSTLFAVGALRLSGVATDHPDMTKALGFVERCQNFGPGLDGGFFFSPDVPDANKAGPVSKGDPGRFRSYGSMSADGLRLMVSLGVDRRSPRFEAAAGWLRSRFEAGKNPGDFPESRALRQESAYFYYTWTIAHALRHLGEAEIQTRAGKVKWAEALAEALIERQSADGAWRNSYTEMREDDPLIATSFALAALTLCQSVVESRHRAHTLPVP